MLVQRLNTAKNSMGMRAFSQVAHKSDKISGGENYSFPQASEWLVGIFHTSPVPISGELLSLNDPQIMYHDTFSFKLQFEIDRPAI